MPRSRWSCTPSTNVKANYAFKKGELKNADIDKIVSDGVQDPAGEGQEEVSGGRFVAARQRMGFHTATGLLPGGVVFRLYLDALDGSRRIDCRGWRWLLRLHAGSMEESENLLRILIAPDAALA